MNVFHDLDRRSFTQTSHLFVVISSSKEKKQ